MFEILGYSIIDLEKISNLLHSCSRNMRNLLNKNYFDLKRALNETHCSIEAMVLLTHNYKTSRAAHQSLEKS